MSKVDHSEDVVLDDVSLVEEPHTGLPVDPVVELKQDEARLFAIEGSVLKTSHRSGAAMDLSGAVLVGDPVVPIVDGSGNTLGSAKLSMVDDEIVAEGTLLYSCPERLSVETGLDLYFNMDGHIEVSGGGNGRLVIGSRIFVKSLFLTTTHSADPRIKPVRAI